MVQLNHTASGESFTRKILIYFDWNASFATWNNGNNWNSLNMASFRAIILEDMFKESKLNTWDKEWCTTRKFHSHKNAQKTFFKDYLKIWSFNWKPNNSGRYRQKPQGARPGRYKMWSRIGSFFYLEANEANTAGCEQTSDVTQANIIRTC